MGSRTGGAMVIVVALAVTLGGAFTVWPVDIWLDTVFAGTKLASLNFLIASGLIVFHRFSGLVNLTFPAFIVLGTIAPGAALEHFPMAIHPAAIMGIALLLAALASVLVFALFVQPLQPDLGRGTLALLAVAIIATVGLGGLDTPTMILPDWSPFAAAAVLGIGFLVFRNWHAPRLMMRASQSNPELARMLGLRLGRFALAAFVMSCVLAMLAGVLLIATPTEPLVGVPVMAILGGMVFVSCGMRSIFLCAFTSLLFGVVFCFGELLRVDGGLIACAALLVGAVGFGAARSEASV